jgi:F-type H+-transporting ATPase subunit b|tara:strand:- start:2532 stop:3023 length:492 start_codon:yes stop_codon:yes gene_type:complete
MPQLNPEFFVSQLFWLAVFFSFLLIFLWRVSLPRISLVLEKRQRKIDENLSSAKMLQEQAQEIESNINNKISKAKQDADEKIKKAISSLQSDVSTKLSTLDEELEIKISNSEKEILRSKESQMKNIDNEIANITKITVSKITNLSISESEIEQAIKTRKGLLS